MTQRFELPGKTRCTWAFPDQHKDALIMGNWSPPQSLIERGKQGRGVETGQRGDARHVPKDLARILGEVAHGAEGGGLL